MRSSNSPSPWFQSRQRSAITGTAASSDDWSIASATNFRLPVCADSWAVNVPGMLWASALGATYT